MSEAARDAVILEHTKSLRLPTVGREFPGSFIVADDTQVDQALWKGYTRVLLLPVTLFLLVTVPKGAAR